MSQSPVQRVYCCMDSIKEGTWKVEGEVAIPCSKGLLLHAATEKGQERRDKKKSQSPVQRVYCCMSLREAIAGQPERKSQSPVQRVYCCMSLRGTTSGCARKTSQSPVQRVYCCMSFLTAVTNIATARSQSPVQRVYCCMPSAPRRSSRIVFQKSQSPVQRVYCCMKRARGRAHVAVFVAIPCSKGLLLHVCFQ